jgi:hypothetical protein
MSANKNTPLFISAIFVVALGLGVALGYWLQGKSSLKIGKQNDPALVPIKDVNWDEQTLEQLGESLSQVMLPEDEFLKLQAAIFQTGMGLFMAQAQSAGLTVTDSAQQELKKAIEDKYTRKYFADMNAGSMKELTKPEFISVLSFYNTEAGQKFLRLSPKIIQSTMTEVQKDLAAWLPKTVETLVAKGKGGEQGKPEGDDVKKDNVKEEEKPSTESKG